MQDQSMSGYRSRKIKHGLKFICVLVAILCTYPGEAQNKYEREYRIKKSEFPQRAYQFIAPQLQEARAIRFIREIDSNKSSYEVKFKKDRLRYSVEFNNSGMLEDIEIQIKEIDIPGETLRNIKSHLTDKFGKFRIRKIQQQYPVSASEPPEETRRNAFQNLILPTINYELIIAAREKRGYQNYEILFDASGTFIKLRKVLQASYDHVLY